MIKSECPNFLSLGLFNHQFISRMRQKNYDFSKQKETCNFWKETGVFFKRKLQFVPKTGKVAKLLYMAYQIKLFRKTTFFPHKLFFFHETRKLQIWAKLSKLSEDDTYQENNALTTRNVNLTKRENEKLDEGCPVWFWVFFLPVLSPWKEKLLEMTTSSDKYPYWKSDFSQTTVLVCSTMVSFISLLMLKR